MGKELTRRGDDTLGKVEAALSRAKEREKETRSLPPAPRGSVSAGGEIFELAAVCAVHDRSYVLRYIRQASGLLRFTESLKAAAPGNPRQRISGAAGQVLPLAEFEGGSEFPCPCPWCGSNSINGPCICGALVCGGRKRNGVFRCRDSCGAEWRGEDMAEVEAAKERPVSSSRAAAGASRPVAKAERVAIPASRRLGPGAGVKKP